MASWRIHGTRNGIEASEYVEAGDELRALEVARSRGLEATARGVTLVSAGAGAGAIDDRTARAIRAMDKRQRFSPVRVVALLVVVLIVLALIAL